MPTTPTYAFRYPASGDAPNGPQAIQNLATDVEGAMNRPFGHAGITAGFITISAANGAYPTLVAQTLKNGMTFSGGGLVVPKAGVYEITAKGYFTGGTVYQGQWGATINTAALPPASIASGPGMTWKQDANDYTAWSTVRRTLAANDVIRLYMKSPNSTYGTDGYNGSYIEVVWVMA